MIVNITMIARDRNQLTRQALESLDNTPRELANLLVLDDGSEPAFLRPPQSPVCIPALFYRNDISSGGAGKARNRAIRLSEQCFGRGDLLYCSDNDVLFTPGWLEKLLAAWPEAKALGFKVLGGYAHPYNRFPVEGWTRTDIVENYALASQSWLMEWETWDKYGPLAENPGVRQSEDVEFTNKVRGGGFKVGHIFPHVVHATSRRDTFGKLIPGWELIPDLEGVTIL